MSTQQDIYAAGSESRPPMLNKENYVPWSSRLLRYAKSRPNGKLIHNSIINGPYVRRMIPELCDTNRKVPVNETFHVQTNDELTKKELKQIEADDQAILTILLGLLEDIYAAVDSCETTQEIWLRVHLKAKTSNVNFLCTTSGKCVLNEKHDMCVLKSRNGVNSRTKMPIVVPVSTREPKRIVKQSVAKPLRKTVASEYSQKPRYTTRKLYEHVTGSESRPPMLNKENYVPWSSCLLGYAKNRTNRKLIHNSIINGTYIRRMIPEPGDTNWDVPMNETFHTILLGLPEDIYAVVDCESAQEIWLRVQQMMKGSDIGIQEKKAKLINEWERFTSNKGESIESYYHRQNGVDMLLSFIRPRTCLRLITLNCNGGNQFRQYAGNLTGYNDVQNIRNQNEIGNGNLVAARAEGNTAGQNGNQIRCYNCRGVGHYARNCTVRPKRRDAAYIQTQLLIAQKEEAGIQLQAEEYDLMAATADLD
nr:hypothetical protein [Tanacetum cinerariifolium]